MNNAELYMVLKEKCVNSMTLDRTEFCKKLKNMPQNIIVEVENGKYHIFYPVDILKEQAYMQNEVQDLIIDPAVRLRFEGGIDEYEELLKEISKKRMGNSVLKVLGKLREDNADSDFFIMDVYYRM